MKRTTMADVARAAGTSTAVVSYVLNPGTRPVSEALRERVLAAVDELDYRPDRHARALRRRRGWGQIGFIVPDATLPLYGALVSHLERAGRARGQLLITGSTGFDIRVERELVQGLLDAGVDGLLAATIADARGVEALCAQARVPLVWVHNAGPHPSGVLVGADHVQAGRLAAEHLHTVHGRQRVAFVGSFLRAEAPTGDRGAVRDRHRGYVEVLAGNAEQILSDLTLPGAYRTVSERLASGPAPDGLVVGTFSQSAPVLRAVLDAGLRVPEDVAIVTFDSDPRNPYEAVTLTAVQQPVDLIAAHALDLVLGGGEAATGSPLWAVTLAAGESCGCTHKTLHP